MARVHDLIGKIADVGLREALATEIKKLEKNKKFGLVFEEHLPEAAAMPGVPVRAGMTVATREQDGGALYFVKEIAAGTAKCVDETTRIEVEFPVSGLVAVTKFGEPIYPYLEKVDEIEHGGGDLWHTLIQADNYHALQLLEYLYAGKVDCIYIDPPYNTGAKDWKYNNDYVDGNDAWRHSKWLSMMEKRLRIAKRLLNPKDSVLIVTIDEKEYLHLGMLLEQMFPEARIQMVSSVINPSGKTGDGFSVTAEYLYFVFIGNCVICKTTSDFLFESKTVTATGALTWESLLRRGNNWSPAVRPNLFYPVLIDRVTEQIVGVGGPAKPEEEMPREIDGKFAAWPIKKDGSYAIWRVDSQKLKKLVEMGYARVSSFDEKRNTYSMQYLMSGDIGKIESGEIAVTRVSGKGPVQSDAQVVKVKTPKDVWVRSSHNASSNGTDLISALIGRSKFSFPKSLYAVHDAIRFFVANKPNALILDFFAGSGTTLHAVNLLNAEDGGKRRCILVTNNEVSDDEAKAFRKAGLKPGDAEWEAKGIAQYVTWPRTTCAIKGVNVKGEPLKGSYLGGDADNPRQMADGFQANAAFFKLGFLEPTPVGLGRRFKELLPVLWMKAGAAGRCPEVRSKSEEGITADGFLVFTENRFAVLFAERAFAAFKKEVKAAKTIETIYVVTDFDPSYRAMAKAFPGKAVYPLYRDYLDSFRINASRS